MLTATNVHDPTVFEELVDSVAPAKGRRGSRVRGPKSCTPTKVTINRTVAGSGQSPPKSRSRVLSS